MPPLGAGLDMIGEKMVEFKRIGNSIIVNELSSVTTKRSKPGEDASLDRAVAESALPSVLFNLPIVAESPTGALVVDFGLPLMLRSRRFQRRQRLPDVGCQGRLRL